MKRGCEVDISSQFKRHIYHDVLSRLKGDLPFIQVIVGPRQVGKSTAIQQVLADWPHKKHFHNCDSVVPYNYEWLSLQWQKAQMSEGPVLLVFDEIQKVEGWSEVIKKLYEESRKRPDFYVVLLGSASLSITQGLSDSLVGRYELISAHHWSLDECHQVFGWDLMTYLKFGGYPAAASLIADIDRWQSFIRNAIIDPVLNKDLRDLARITKPALFRQAFELALNYPAQEISYQKLLGQLQDHGNVATIKHYLHLFEGAFLIRALEKYSSSIVRAKASSPKIVVMDSGLLHYHSHPKLVDSDSEWLGRIFENAIGAHLAKQPGRLFYWRDGNREVDYVWQTRWGNYAIEVKSGRVRGREALIQFVEKFPTFVPVVLDLTKGAELLNQRIITADLMNRLASTT